MPRTTIDLDANVTRNLKRRAERERKSMGQVDSDLLARALADEPAASPFEWKSYDMGVPLIDLEDKDALYRIFDENE
jgi:hypothetical protein